ncbi:MAG: hypothetical protein JW791_02045 [Nanoarchaeota archaeon]|nr:hypothetical protein [Nanoarchaeota archaeon]
MKAYFHKMIKAIGFARQAFCHPNKGFWETAYGILRKGKEVVIDRYFFKDFHLSSLLSVYNSDVMIKTNEVIKVIIPVPRDNLTAHERFNNEVHFLREGSNLTPELLETGRFANGYYIKESLIPGCSLEEEMLKGEVKSDAFFKIGFNLRELHGLGIAHGDLMPKNIVGLIFIDGEDCRESNPKNISFDINTFSQFLNQEQNTAFNQGYVNTD